MNQRKHETSMAVNRKFVVFSIFVSKRKQQCCHMQIIVLSINKIYRYANFVYYIYIRKRYQNL